ncbi:MAG: methyltransferase domain-containing protein, partial [Candidatus Acidiferrales bacterium]
MELVAYTCPYCGANLITHTDSLECSSCHHTFDVLEGVPCFKQDKGYYYGEVPQDTMRRLLAAARAGEWRPEFERILEGMQYPLYHRQYAISERRAGWWPLLAISPESKVLDWGCGWGGISYALAKHAGLVVSCDACLERLQFLRVRALQENNTKLQFAWAGDTPRFPFSDGQFDLVILNGVLEWVTMTRDGNPGEVQKAFLREVARVLTPNGQLMLAMENRFNLYYFLGKPEDHAQLRYVSLMPRMIAAAYSKLRTGRTYRNWTYSYSEHKRNLQATGFSNADIFVPLPDYRLFQAIVDPERRDTVEQYFFERDAGHGSPTAARIKASAAKLLSPSFCVVGHRGEKPQSFLQALGKEIAQRLGHGASVGPAWKQYRITRSDVILFELESARPGPGTIVKLPLNDAALARCQRGFDAMTAVRAKLSPELGNLVPAPLVSGFFRGTPYFAEGANPGISASCFAKSNYKNNWKPLAVKFLAGLHKQTARRERLDSEAWRRIVLPQISEGLAIVERQIGIEARRLEAFLAEQLNNKVWPFAFNHGDFWAGNLLVDANSTKLTGLIDWEYAEIAHGLPLVDILNASIFSYSEAYQESVPSLIGKALTSGRNAFWDAPMLNSYLSTMECELTNEEFQAFLALYWVHLISARRTFGKSESFDERNWMRLYVQPAETWIGQLSGKS